MLSLLLRTGCLWLLLFGLLPSPTLPAQPLRLMQEVPVRQQGRGLPLAWAGGLNQPQFSQADLDGDGRQDLFVFDRAGDLPLVLLGDPAQPGGYRYAPEAADWFPPMRFWALLRDFDCDGRADLFTASDNNSIRVLRNTGGTGTPVFVPYRASLQLPDGSDIFVSNVDLPAIDDADGDGDPDLITFDPAGSYVMWFENTGGCDSLHLVVNTACWGSFQEAGLSSDITLHVSCKRGSGYGLRHAGSTLCLFDPDGDGVQDLLLGDLNSERLAYLHNGGTPAVADMDAVVPQYPTAAPVALRQFVAAFRIDADADGTPDLVVAPNGTDVSLNAQSVWYYRNTGTPAQWQLDLQSTALLQGDMIDLGERAKPAFFDYDSDGLPDLVVGCYLYRVEAGQERSSLALFRNTGTAQAPAFQLVQTDYLGLSTFFSPPRFALHPAFGDLDGDGDADLLLGDEEGELHFFRNTAPAGATAQFVLAAATLGGIDVGGHAAPQIADLDGDGLPDLLVGERSGNLNFFRNGGTAQVAAFPVQDAAFGGVDVQPGCCTGFSVPHAFRTATGAWELLVGSEFGDLRHYTGLDKLDSTFTLQTLHYGGIRAGAYLAPAAADLGGGPVWVVGNGRGGLGLYGSAGTSAVAAQRPPWRVHTWRAGAYAYLRAEAGEPLAATVWDMQGRALWQGEVSAAATQIDVQDWPRGLYVLVCRDGQGWAWHEKLLWP
ncbi:MAG: hypothetical protein OHK0039_10240 [Bacteroidia bacterium]